MESNNVIFKRVKINRWIIVASSVTFFTLIFLYILYGNGIFISMTCGSFVMLMDLQYIITVDDNFVIFKTYFKNVFKISISDIENVEVKQEPLNFFKFYQFDFLEKEVVSIQLKTGKTYKLRIKNAQEIKEEIEKRMIITNKPK